MWWPQTIHPRPPIQLMARIIDWLPNKTFTAVKEATCEIKPKAGKIMI